MARTDANSASSAPLSSTLSLRVRELVTASSSVFSVCLRWLGFASPIHGDLDGSFIPQLRDDLVAVTTETRVISPGLGMPLRLIPNERLLLPLIPEPEAELWGWERFAHTIHGYDVMGVFEAQRERHIGGMTTNKGGSAIC